MNVRRRVIGGLLNSRASAPLFRQLVRGRASVFMFHRFRMPDLGVEGHDPAALQRMLEIIRRRRIEVVSLESLFADRETKKSSAQPSIAFTIDDGYVDHAQVGAPIFAAFECPVTTFVTSGYLDRQLWFWWDQIEFIFLHATRCAVEAAIGDARIPYGWRDGAARLRAQFDFTERCKKVPDETKLDAIRELAIALEVEVPTRAPSRYAPMEWGDLRRCEQSGMSFGPHTVTHPILSRTSDRQSQFELSESWRRLRAEARRPAAVFCYPNGQSGDFGSREIATLRALGIRGAVVGGRDGTGYAQLGRFAHDADASYKVRRFAYDESPMQMLQIINGVERLKQLIRRER